MNPLARVSVLVLCLTLAAAMLAVGIPGRAATAFLLAWLGPVACLTIGFYVWSTRSEG